MKRTALNQCHIDAGAKMVEFVGYEMPLQYAGLKQEHMAVRENAGMFDVSHMGEFIVHGAQATAFLQWCTTNNVEKLQLGGVQYSCLPNETGGIVDDLLIYKLEEENYMLVVNASNIEKDWQWLQTQNMRFGANLINQSDKISLLALQGPRAKEILQKHTSVNLDNIPYYNFKIDTVANIPDVFISNTGYTGAGGFELYVDNAKATQLWDALSDNNSLVPAGLAARDTLRLEMGFCLYGNDIDDTTSPIEAGLGWITKFDKTFINCAQLEKQKQEKPARKLVGFIMQERGIPRQGYAILNQDGDNIGRVTSGTMSPFLNEAIGLGYVKSAYAKPDTAIAIKIRDKPIAAIIKKPPFIN